MRRRAWSGLFVVMGIVTASTLGVDARAAPKPAPPSDALFDRVASGDVRLETLIDRSFGLVLVDGFAGPADDDAPPKVPARVCGAELDAAIARWESTIKTTVQRMREDDRTIVCERAMGGTTCTLGATMEWDPAVHYVFVPRAGGGHRLKAIVVLDEVLVEESVVAEERAVAARTIARLGKGKCPVVKKATSPRP